MPGPSHRIKFGDYEFDQQSGELWTNSRCVVLPKQPSHILTVLIARRGKLVPRQRMDRSFAETQAMTKFSYAELDGRLRGHASAVDATSMNSLRLLQ